MYENLKTHNNQLGITQCIGTFTSAYTKGYILN